jgi:type 1 glutamine amidotransferase
MVGRTDSYAVELIQSLQDIIPEIILNRNVSTMNASELQILLSPVKDILADIDPGRLLNAATVIQQGNAAPLGNG